MAFPQLTYTTDMALAFEGANADGSTDSFGIIASNTAAASFFGRACLAVTTDGEQFVQPTGSAGVFLGVLQHSHAIEQDEVVAGAAGLPANHPGRVWVVAEVAITDITAGVFYRHTNAGALPEALGRFRNDTTDATEIPGARWVRTTAGAGQLTIIEFNLP